MIAKISFQLFILCVSSALMAQNKRFELLLSHFEEAGSEIPMELAAEYFGIEQENKIERVLSGDILLQNERFTALAVRIPCPYGDLCYAGRLGIFSRKGKRIAEIEDFESRLVDDGLDDEKKCVIASDSVLVFRTRGFEFEPGNEEEVISSEITITVLRLSSKGQVTDQREIAIDLRRKHSYASLDLLGKDAMQNISNQELEEMRSELLAAHGLKFEDARLRDYYNEKEWYLPKLDSVDHLLTPIERTNLELISKLLKNTK